MKLVNKQSAFVLATLALAPLVASTVSAAEVGSLKSNSIVTFQQGGATVTPPVDPQNPTDPSNPPVDPANPGTSGPLSIDFASNWKFGTQTVSAQDTTYYAHPQVMKDGTTRQLYAQVTDVRGSFAGWTLSMRQDGQFKDSAGNALTGAALSFAGTGATSSTSKTPASSVTKSFALTPGVDQKLVAAAVNEGTGTNVYSFGTPTAYDAAATTDAAVATKGPVQLKVAGGSMRATAYTTSLTWTLSDVPAS